MRQLHDPASLLLLAAGVGAASTIFSGFQKAGELEDQAAFADLQRSQTQKQTRRDLDDLDKEKARHLARTRAVLAASGGGDVGFGTGLALQKSQAADFATTRHRIVDDSVAQETTLKVRADNLRSSADVTRLGAIFGGAAKVGVGIGDFSNSQA